MRIGFIGAGKMGFTLGKYLVEKNLTEISKELDYSVSGYYSHTNYDGLNKLIKKYFL